MRIATLLVFTMLSLCLAVTASGDRVQDNSSTSDGILAILKKLGYKTETSPAEMQAVILTKKGIRVNASIEERPGADSKLHPYALQLTRRYQLTQPINADALNERASEANESGIIFTSYLDRTLSARKTIQLDPGFNEDRLKGDLEGYWSYIGRMQTFLPTGSWKIIDSWATPDSPPLDEHAVINQALREDFSYLLKSWNWERPTSAGNSFTWWLDATVDKQWVQFRGVIENGVVDPFKVDVDVISQSPKFADSKMQDQLKHLDWASATLGGNNYVTLRTVIDLRQGMTVTDLKKRVVQFVHKAAALTQ
ncbi:MAG TPA: hypothetical protein VMI31_01920 [Fimbriimonadaceae bacterium]|nr:hypothetical protein [Fimbriimonadaceae bacterium]